VPFVSNGFERRGDSAARPKQGGNPRRDGNTQVVVERRTLCWCWTFDVKTFARTCHLPFRASLLRCEMLVWPRGAQVVRRSIAINEVSHARCRRRAQLETQFLPQWKDYDMTDCSCCDLCCIAEGNADSLRFCRVLRQFLLDWLIKERISPGSRSFVIDVYLGTIYA